MIATAVIAAIPSLIKLFSSDSRSDGAKELTQAVVQEAGKKLGINFTTKEDLVTHLNSNPEDATKLREIETSHLQAIAKLKLENKKEDNRHIESKEQNITNRWNSDNEADSRFAKLIRPVLVAFLVSFSVVMALIDGNIVYMSNAIVDGVIVETPRVFIIKAHWVTLFTELTLSVIGGYFILRTYEKRTNTSKWDKR